MNEENLFDEKKRMSMRIWAMLPGMVLITLIVIVAALTMRTCSEMKRLKEEKLAELHTSSPPVNVVVLRAEPRPIRDRLDLPGVVEPWVELKLLTEVSGRVVELHVNEGDRVKKGDLIASVDPRDYENALANARASYELAIKEHERVGALYSEELVPKSALDKAAAVLESAKAQMGNAELMLERCAIKSPMDGVVNRLDAKEGLLLSPSDPVATLLDTDRVKVTVGIPESDVDAARDIESFDVKIDALGGRVFKGRKNFLSSAPDSLARLYALKIEVPNPNGEILPGMFAKVDVVKKLVRGALSVPIYSVISRNNNDFVFVEKDGKASMKPVKTGILEGWMLEIKDGLSAGDKVIVVGQRNVDDGQALNVVRAVEKAEELFK